MGFNPFSPFNGPFNGEKYFSINTFISSSEIQKNGLLNGAKDGLKSVTCKQTLKEPPKIAMLTQWNIRRSSQTCFNIKWRTRNFIFLLSVAVEYPKFCPSVPQLNQKLKKSSSEEFRLVFFFLWTPSSIRVTASFVYP